MGPNISKLSFPQKWKPGDPEKAASVAQGRAESLFCNGWGDFFFIYSVHINTSEHTSLGGGDRGCGERVCSGIELPWIIKRLVWAFWCSLIDSESPRKKLADESKLRNGQLFALSPAASDSLSWNLESAVCYEDLFVSTSCLRSKFGSWERREGKKQKELARGVICLVYFSFHSLVLLKFWQTVDGICAGVDFLHWGRYSYGGQSRTRVTGEPKWPTHVTARESGSRGCHWQICWVHMKERSTGTGAWQQPLTFPECPDVNGIPLLIHIILPSQHRRP